VLEYLLKAARHRRDVLLVEVRGEVLLDAPPVYRARVTLMPAMPVEGGFAGAPEERGAEVVSLQSA